MGGPGVGWEGWVESPRWVLPYKKTEKQPLCAHGSTERSMYGVPVRPRWPLAAVSQV